MSSNWVFFLPASPRVHPVHFHLLYFPLGLSSVCCGSDWAGERLFSLRHDQGGVWGAEVKDTSMLTDILRDTKLHSFSRTVAIISANYATSQARKVSREDNFPINWLWLTLSIATSSDSVWLKKWKKISVSYPLEYPSISMLHVMTCDTEISEKG